MDIQALVKLISESGMGVLSFAALLYGGWKIIVWMEDLRSNHIPHLNSQLERLVENSNETNSKLDELLRK